MLLTCSKRSWGCRNGSHAKRSGLPAPPIPSIPLAQSPADPDAQLRGWLRAYSTTNPCHGFRRAWAALRHDEHREVNKKKVHRLWTEEGLQRRVHSPRKRAGQSSCLPEVAADASKVVWALDFQFDSTIDGKAIKIASMVDEHTRESLLNIVERSITAERLIDELQRCFAAAGGPPLVLRMDNGPELISQALQQFCAGKGGLSYIPPGTPWNNAYIESFNNRLHRECLNRNHWTNLLEHDSKESLFRPDRSPKATATSMPAEMGRSPAGFKHVRACR